MFNFNYTLKKEHLQECNSFLALHDAKVQKKMITLMIGLLSIIAAITLIMFNLSLLSGIIIVVSAVLILLGFPKLYWKIVFNRISKSVERAPLDFKPIHLEFQDEIKIVQGKDGCIIPYTSIQNQAYTKNCLLLFYEANSRLNTLILPMNEIASATSLIEFIEGKRNHE